MDSTGKIDNAVPTKLFAGFEQLAGCIQDPTIEAHQMFVKLFNVCPGSLASQGDRDNTEMAITTYPVRRVGGDLCINSYHRAILCIDSDHHLPSQTSGFHSLCMHRSLCDSCKKLR